MSGCHLLQVLSYTNMFFTCKNTLVCMLLLYRLIVIQLERYKLLKEIEEGDTATMKENKRLLLSSCTTDQYYNYSTKVILRELQQPIDPSEKTITYIIKRHMSLPTSLADFSAERMAQREPTEYSFNSMDDIRTLYGREFSFAPGDFELLPIAAYDVGGASSYASISMTGSEGAGLGGSCVVDVETQTIDDLMDIADVIVGRTDMFQSETDSEASLAAILRAKTLPKKRKASSADATTSPVAAAAAVTSHPVANCNSNSLTITVADVHCSNNVGHNHVGSPSPYAARVDKVVTAN